MAESISDDLAIEFDARFSHKPSSESSKLGDIEN